MTEMGREGSALKDTPEMAAVRKALRELVTEIKSGSAKEEPAKSKANSPAALTLAGGIIASVLTFQFNWLASNRDHRRATLAAQIQQRQELIGSFATDFPRACYFAKRYMEESIDRRVLGARSAEGDAKAAAAMEALKPEVALQSYFERSSTDALCARVMGAFGTTTPAGLLAKEVDGLADKIFELRFTGGSKTSEELGAEAESLKTTLYETSAALDKKWQELVGVMGSSFDEGK